MGKLEGKTVFLTGGGGGIGRAIATSLAKEKARIVLIGGNNEEKLKKTFDEVTALNAECLVFKGDLTCDKALDDMFDKAIDTVKKVDILINNAGVAHSQEFEKVTRAELDKIMNVNFRAPYMLTQRALPYLLKSNYASIINIASVVSHAGYPLQSAYTASKHALLGFTKSLAIELYEKGVRVHAISPGGVYTDMIKVSRPDLTSDGMIMPEEIADIVKFLLENRGNAVIDEIIVHRVKKQPFLV